MGRIHVAEPGTDPMSLIAKKRAHGFKGGWDFGLSPLEIVGYSLALIGVAFCVWWYFLRAAPKVNTKLTPTAAVTAPANATEFIAPELGMSGLPTETPTTTPTPNGETVYIQIPVSVPVTQVVEVTRQVEKRVNVRVEVTRIAEVTRIVERVVTVQAPPMVVTVIVVQSPTPAPKTATPTATATATETETSTATATATATPTEMATGTPVVFSPTKPPVLELTVEPNRPMAVGVYLPLIQR